MKIEITLLAATFSVTAIWLFWRAHLIWNRDRIDLVRLGSKSLPGAERLKGQFAAVPLLQGLCILATAALLTYTNSISPWLYLCLFTVFVIVGWNSVLARGLENYAAHAAKREA